MKCGRCGRELSSEAKYCPTCGLEVQSAFTRELIEAAQNNDQTAITRLYNETYNYVYQTIRAIIKTDDDTVLDLVQDAYMKAFQNLDQLDKPENFRPWVKRIGANTAKNYLKKKKPVLFSELEREDEEPREFQFQDELPDHMPEEVLDRKETARLVEEILGTLSEDQRLAINMFYFQEMTVKEIAEELECSENTVKSRLNYGRKKVENKVRELEKKGTKLYGLAPLPFFMFLFRAQEASAAALPNAQILHAVQTGIVAKSAVGTAVKSAAGTAAKATAGTAAKGTAGKAAGAAAKTAVKGGIKATATKVVAGVAATAVIGTAGVAVYNHSQPSAAREEFIQAYASLQEQAAYESYDTMNVYVYDNVRDKNDWDVVIILSNRSDENETMANYAVMDEGVLSQHTFGDDPSIPWIDNGDVIIDCTDYFGNQYEYTIDLASREVTDNIDLMMDGYAPMRVQSVEDHYDLTQVSFDETGYQEILKKLK